MRLFRGTRRRLMQENRFTKYLAYAAGEILLVTVGILIAVQINDWAKRRTLAERELDYLAEIRADIQQDADSLARLVDSNALKVDIITRVLAFLDGDDEAIDPTKPEETMPRLNSFELFLPDRIAFDNMAAVETVGLISDPELRKLLSSYYVFVDNHVTGTPERVAELTRRLADLTMSGFSRHGRRPPREQAVSDPEIAAGIMRSAMDDPETIAVLINMAFVTETQTDEARDLLGKAEECIAAIDAFLADS